MNKIFLILGASSDMGLALIRRLYDGNSVFVAHYNSSFDAIDRLTKELGDKVIGIHADFSSSSSMEQFIVKVREIGVPTHIVHFSSERVVQKKFNKTVWNDFELHFNVQLRSIVAILLAFLPAMSSKKIGKVLFVLSSYTVGVPPAYLTPYVTTKYALLGLMRALASEYSGKCITFNAVSPSMTETKFLNDTNPLAVEMNASKNPMSRNAVVSDIVPTIVSLLSDESGYITGNNIVISGGLVF